MWFLFSIRFYPSLRVQCHLLETAKGILPIQVMVGSWTFVFKPSLLTKDTSEYIDLEKDDWIPSCMYFRWNHGTGKTHFSCAL